MRPPGPHESAALVSTNGVRGVAAIGGHAVAHGVRGKLAEFFPVAWAQAPDQSQKDELGDTWTVVSTQGIPFDDVHLGHGGVLQIHRRSSEFGSV